MTAPTAAWAIDIVVYNQSDSPIRLGGQKGPLAAPGKSARYSTPKGAEDLVIYVTASRCAYSYAFSAIADGFPWGQSPTAPFKLQLGKITDLAILPQDVTASQSPRPRQPPGFPLLPPRVRCAAR